MFFQPKIAAPSWSRDSLGRNRYKMTIIYKFILKTARTNEHPHAQIAGPVASYQDTSATSFLQSCRVFCQRGGGLQQSNMLCMPCYTSWFVQSSLHMGHAVSHTFDVPHSSLGHWAIVAHWSILKLAWPKKMKFLTYDVRSRKCQL